MRDRLRRSAQALYRALLSPLAWSLRASDLSLADYFPSARKTDTPKRIRVERVFRSGPIVLRAHSEVASGLRTATPMRFRGFL